MLLVKSLEAGGVERVALDFLDGLRELERGAWLGLLDHHTEIRPAYQRAVLVPPALQLNSRDRFYELRGVFRYPYFAARIWKLLRACRPRTVVTFCLETLMGLALVRRLPGCPPLEAWFAMVGSDTYEGVRLRVPPLAGPVRGVLGWFYGQPDGLLAASNGLRERLLELYGLPPEGVHLLYNPIDVERISELSRAELSISERPFFLGVGRLIRAKGFDLLIRAFHRARPQLNGAELVILGQGREGPNLRSMVERLGLGDSVKLPGFESNPWRYMSRSLAVVVPSYSEGFSLVTAEALAAGAPVIVTDCPHGPQEIVAQGEFGEVVARGSEEELAAALVRLAEDAPRRQELARKGPHRASDFAGAKIMSRFVNLADQLASSS